ncbi:MAG: hypothetical protein FJ100_16985 [Deltaproteobacteria bacterium]|nr:hypothetical protein [Deltaproteobacteria bacterium]
MNSMIVILPVLALLACSKPVPKTAVAPPDAAPAALAPAPARPGLAEAARPSEHVASNKPDPHCKDCVGPDASVAQPYTGKPEIALDPKTLAEVQASLDANNALLEQGIDILEKHAKAPDKAQAALDKFLADKKNDIAAAQATAAEIRARIKAVGYDQDIPAELRADFEKRMGAISERLERVREAYKQRTDILTAFGRLFPRPH